MRHTPCSVLQVTCGVHQGNLQHAPRTMDQAPWTKQHVTHTVQHASRTMQHASSTQHPLATFTAPHATCNRQQTTSSVRCIRPKRRGSEPEVATCHPIRLQAVGEVQVLVRLGGSPVGLRSAASPALWATPRRRCALPSPLLPCNARPVMQRAQRIPPATRCATATPGDGGHVEGHEPAVREQARGAAAVRPRAKGGLRQVPPLSG